MHKSIICNDRLLRGRTIFVLEGFFAKGEHFYFKVFYKMAFIQ